MFVEALKNIRIKGAHVEQGKVAETDPATGRSLIASGFAKAAEKPAAPKKKKAAKKSPPDSPPEE